MGNRELRVNQLVAHQNVYNFETIQNQLASNEGTITGMSIMNIMLMFLLSFLPFTQTMTQCFGLAFMEAGGSMNDYGTTP